MLMGMEKKKEILTNAVISFMTTFFGVFLAVGVDKAISKYETRELSLKMIASQASLCSFELEKLKQIDITERPISINAGYFITLMPLFLQTFGSEIKPEPFSSFNQSAMKLSLLSNTINNIERQTPGKFFAYPTRHPDETDAQWEDHLMRYERGKAQWVDNMKLLEEKVNDYISNFESTCSSLQKFELES